MDPVTVIILYENHECLLDVDNSLSNKIDYTMVNKPDYK